MPLLRKLKTAAPAALLLLAVAVVDPATAQTGDGLWMATRPQLEGELTRAEGLAASPAYGARTRQRARGLAAEIRVRLDAGDFRVGDRMLLRVDGAIVIDDTVTVLDDIRISARGIGEIPLRGVLRSELEPHLRAAITERVRDATVAARPLVRIAVFGAVGTPGYLSVPAETRLDDLLMVAGGPSTESRPAGFELRRGDVVILDADGVRAAIAEGSSLGALSVREGDFLAVEPRAAPWTRESTIQIVGMLMFPILSIFLVR